VLEVLRRVYSLGFRVLGVEVEIKGSLGCRVYIRFRVQGLRVQS